MKKTLITTFVLFSVLLIFYSCKEHKIKTETEKLIGTWTGDIGADQWCDSNNFNKVVLQLQENNVALLNYTGPDGDRWNTPYVCKWWVDRKKANNPYSFVTLPTKKYFYFLYISVDDTLCDPCHTRCDYYGQANCYYYWTFPDTVSYQITDLEDNTMTISKRKGFVISGNNDLLFSRWHGDMWFGYFIKKLYKQN